VPARLLAGLHRRESALADEDVMERVHGGDAAAFEVIFDRHAGPAFSLAYRMCGRRAMAEDIVQETFLSLWRGGGHYDPARGSVRTWVLRAVHNKAIDSFRHEASRTGHDVSDDVAAERVASLVRTDIEAQRLDDAREVRDALDQLPVDQRRVIELAYFGGFTHSQIAEMLDLPTGTVKSRMRLAMTKLRLSLGGSQEEELRTGVAQ